jgi:hypothetical protein
MSHTVLDSVAMAYQPVWNRQRLLAAVRLSVLPTDPGSVDAAHLMQVLGDDWPVNAPVLVLALESPELLQQALRCAPVPNTWLEVPAVLFEHVQSMAMLSVAARQGHQLLRRADFAEVRRHFVAPLDARSLLHLSAEDALEALRSRPSEAQPVPSATGGWPTIALTRLVPGASWAGPTTTCFTPVVTRRLPATTS